MCEVRKYFICVSERRIRLAKAVLFEPYYCAGGIKRCYLNRIIAPEAFANLQFQFTASTIKKMKNLICTCGNVIGTPMLYRDGRIAYHLERGTFQRKNITRATFPKESRISER